MYTEWHVDRMSCRQNVMQTEYFVDKMPRWQKVMLTKYIVDKMPRWQNELAPKPNKKIVEEMGKQREQEFCYSSFQRKS